MDTGKIKDNEAYMYVCKNLMQEIREQKEINSKLQNQINRLNDIVKYQLNLLLTYALYYNDNMEDFKLDSNYTRLKELTEEDKTNLSMTYSKIDSELLIQLHNLYNDVEQKENY